MAIDLVGNGGGLGRSQPLNAQLGWVLGFYGREQLWPAASVGRTGEAERTVLMSGKGSGNNGMGGMG